MTNRRTFLKTSSLVSLAPVLPSFLPNSLLAGEGNRDGRILVVVQLDGGNDGINTVVPFRDDGYAKNRRTLRIAEKELNKITDDLGLHPNMESAARLFEEDRMSIVHSVGYPNPNRSHFESMDIWHTANLSKSNRAQRNGWLGDSISTEKLTEGPHIIHVGSEELPVALFGRRCNAATISNSEDLRMVIDDLANDSNSDQVTRSDASLTEFVTRSTAAAYSSAQELSEATKGNSSAKYPRGQLARNLKMVGQMIKADAAANVYYTIQSGYDTHASQQYTHASLLRRFSTAVSAFMQDMQSSKLSDRVLVMAFSEFGRRVAENGSLGTDHGAAGPVFLFGDSLSQPIVGNTPSLTDVENGDLKFQIDFRALYADVARNWLGLSLPKRLAGFALDKSIFT